MSQRLDYHELAGPGRKMMLNLHSYLNHQELPKELLELVYLRASQINGCAFCLDMHTTELVKSGMKTEKIFLVSAWQEGGSYFTDKERAALAWTETVTRVADTHVPDSEYEAARKHFSEKELVDLTMAIGMINAFNRLSISFRTQPASLTQSK